MAGELELPDDLRAEQRAHVGRGGDAVPGPYFFGHASAAHDLAALEDQNAQSGPGEVRRGHEPIVARADDDDIELMRHGYTS